MNSNRIWVFGAVFVILAVVAATWFIGVSPQLAQAATSTLDRTAVESQNQAHEATLDRLKADFEGLDGLNSQLEAAREVVPGDKAESTLLAEIDRLAKSNKVVVASVSLAEPLPYTPTDATDPEVIAAMGSLSAGNFMTIPITFGVVGKYGNILSFIDDLQQGTRLVLVHDLAMGEGTAKSSADATFAFAAETFVLLDSSDVAAPVVDEPAAGEVAEGTTAE